MVQMYYRLENETCLNSLVVFTNLLACKPYNILTALSIGVSSLYGVPLMAYMLFYLAQLKFKKSSYYIWVFLQTLCDMLSLMTDTLRFGDSDYTLSDVAAISCELSLMTNTAIALEWKKQLREWKIVDKLLWMASVSSMLILIPCQLSYTANWYTSEGSFMCNVTLFLQDVNLIILPVWAFIGSGIAYFCLLSVVIIDKEKFSNVTMKGYKKVAFALLIKTVLYTDMYMIPFSLGRILSLFSELHVQNGEWLYILPYSVTRYFYPTCNAILNYWAMHGLWKKTKVVVINASHSSNSTNHTGRSTPKIVVNKH